MKLFIIVTSIVLFPFQINILLGSLFSNSVKVLSYITARYQVWHPRLLAQSCLTFCTCCGQLWQKLVCMRAKWNSIHTLKGETFANNYVILPLHFCIHRVRLKYINNNNKNFKKCSSQHKLIFCSIKHTFTKWVSNVI